LRNHRSLTQTAGRAARNVNGKVIMYADKITDSMQKTIDETARRRRKQMQWNEDHGITPMPIIKQSSAADLIELYETDKEQKQTARAAKGTPGSGRKAPATRIDSTGMPRPYFEEEHQVAAVADVVTEYIMTDPAKIKGRMARVKADMVAAAKDMKFLEAASLRDEYIALEKQLEKLEK
ncbi:MAG: hypothetical protein K2M14_07555, partial [Muribaculaceae bacterium]|nr:hypothetical protein [Muribaculaceae bacterium]